MNSSASVAGLLQCMLHLQFDSEITNLGTGTGPIQIGIMTKMPDKNC